MQVVRILKPTPYTPAADDSPRCYGQLRYRCVETVDGEGVKRFSKAALHFPVGATPVLKDDVAKRLIDDESAELIDERPPVFTDVDSIEAALKGAAP
jgi:hypothetical protein